MRVLVVDERRAERDAMAAPLTARLHLVEALADGKAALAAFAREPAQVVIFAGATSAAFQLLGGIRAIQGPAHPYFMVLFDDPRPSEIAALYAAGMDDFMRRPLVGEELVARVEAPMRIRAYAQSLLSSFAYDWTASVDLTRLRAFRDTPVAIGNYLAQVVGEPIDMVEGLAADPPTQRRLAATLALTLPADKIELRVSVVVGEPAMRVLAATILGDADPADDAQRDVVRELANTAAGALKRIYLAENVSFTMGLPRDAPGMPRSPGPATRWWIGTLARSKAKLAVVCDVRGTGPERVPVQALREGMVVQGELRGESGALLLAAGTRLTATTAARVRRLLGPSLIVEVTNPA